MATNRQDTLDPALLRPGRLDRKIEFPYPSRRERRLIFQTVTGKMNLGPDVDLEDCEDNVFHLWIVADNAHDHHRTDVSRPDRLSSAEIASICQAAGLQGEEDRQVVPIPLLTAACPHSRPQEPIRHPAGRL